MLAAGGAAGLIAAVLDEAAPVLGRLLSVPGPWLLAAVVVAVQARRGGHGLIAPRWWPGGMTAGFLVVAVGAYYVGKYELIASVPWMAAAVWVTAALAGGGAGGWAAGRVAVTPFGLVTLGGLLSGWLAAEAISMPAARGAEALLAVALAGAVLGPRAGPGLAPRATRWLTGFCAGVVAQTAFLVAIRLALGQAG